MPAVGVADREIRARVEQGGDAAARGSEQPLPERVVGRQPFAVVSVRGPVHDLKDVECVPLRARRPVVVDEHPGPSREDVPLACDRHRDGHRAPRRQVHACDLEPQEEHPEREQDVGQDEDALVRYERCERQHREREPEREPEQVGRVLRDQDVERAERLAEERRGEQPEEAEPGDRLGEVGAKLGAERVAQQPELELPAAGMPDRGGDRSAGEQKRTQHRHAQEVPTLAERGCCLPESPSFLLECGLLLRIPTTQTHGGAA